jgi:lauroyl/myristoyl acyltransferase
MRNGHIAKLSNQDFRGDRLDQHIASIFRLVPHKIGLKVLHSVFSSGIFQSIFLRGSLKLISEILPWIDPQSRRGVAGAAAFTKAIRVWQIEYLATCSTEELGYWVGITGRDTLDSAKANGKGVILANSHMGAGRTLPFILRRLGYEIHSYESDLDRLIGARIARDMPRSVHTLPTRADLDLKSVYAMHSLLKEGKTLHLAADGLRGSSRVWIRFNGGLRAFRPTFADLALRTGATILPVFAFSDLKGRVHVQIHDPLQLGSDDIPHNERVEHVVGQYARILEDAWHSHPGNLMMRLLGRYKRLADRNEDTSTGNGP